MDSLAINSCVRFHKLVTNGVKAAKAAPTEVHCAVMTSNKVNIKAATAKHMYQDYKGKRYFFCCGGCPGQFKANPEKFAKNDSIPTPKAPKPGKKG